MTSRVTRLIVGGVALVWAGAGLAQTQVRDATYRGTLVCEKLPFAPVAREALEVKIKDNSVRYVHIVRERSEMSFESGTGTLDGDKLTLAGEWGGEDSKYTASYSGTFVRRSAKLTGTQTWTRQGKTHMRKCEGAIKRPFAAFLPDEGKKK